MLRKTVIVVMLALLVVLPAQAQQDGEPTAPAPPTVIDIAAADPNFSILVAAAQASGLADDLAVRSRTYTVFVPSNESFELLLSQLNLSLDQLLADRALIRRIVQYHIIGGEFTLGSTVLTEPLNVFTYSNDAMTVEFTDNRIVVNGGEAIVTQANIFAANGVVHLIDRLLLPPGIDIQVPPSGDPNLPALPPLPQGTILQIASTRGNLSTFVSAVQAAGLTEALISEGNYTVFAPSNGAFQTLQNDLVITRDSLLADLNLLNTVVPYHVSPNRYFVGDLLNVTSNVEGPTINGAPVGGGYFDVKASIPTLNGAALVVEPGPGTIRLASGQATIQEPDILANNGVLHIIDNVLVP
jgi:transforming growth factor-beta-induced protein